MQNVKMVLPSRAWIDQGANAITVQARLVQGYTDKKGGSRPHLRPSTLRDKPAAV